jgi:predicted dehydrogenase
MPQRLRVGIIGLGPTWERYHLPLRRLRDLFDVRCVYDQRPHRGEAAARDLGCGVAGGPMDLLERPEVEALLLLDRQWFGLWPLGQACRLGKPVYCAPSLVHDDAHADGLRVKVAAGNALVLMALSPAATLARLRAHDLLNRRLGPARLVRCEWVTPRRQTTPATADGLCAPAVLALLYECASLFETEPVSVWTTAAEGAGFGNVLLEFGGGRAAQVSRWAGFDVSPRCRVQVVGEKGTVEAELPRDVRWQDRDGWHTQRLPGQSPRLRLLERFFVAVRSGQRPQPDLAATHRALTWLRAAVRSRNEGKKVVLGG